MFWRVDQHQTPEKLKQKNNKCIYQRTVFCLPIQHFNDPESTKTPLAVSTIEGQICNVLQDELATEKLKQKKGECTYRWTGFCLPIRHLKQSITCQNIT